MTVPSLLASALINRVVKIDFCLLPSSLLSAKPQAAKTKPYLLALCLTQKKQNTGRFVVEFVFHTLDEDETDKKIFQIYARHVNQID